MSLVTARLREGKLPACPYCREAIEAGKACPECSTSYHPDCASQLGRCALLGCDGSFRKAPRRTARRAPRKEAKRPYRLSPAVVVSTLVALAVVVAFLTPFHWEPRKPSNEEAAIETLKQIGLAQQAFRAQPPNDCCFPTRYATLPQLGGQDLVLCSGTCKRLGRELIDPFTARTGLSKGYVFATQPASSVYDTGWIATAAPALPTTTGDRYFAVDHRGVMFSRTDRPFERRPDGWLEIDAYDEVVR